MNDKAKVLAAMLLAASVSAKAARYEIDPGHSTVGFKVAHLVVSKVTGRFARFAGTIEYEKDKPGVWAADVEIDASSIDTGLAARDEHLRNPDFFDTAKYPSITFKSVRAERKGKRLVLIGDLTLHGVTKRLALDLTVNGTVKDPWGGERLGATGTTTISRKEFGLTWNKALESGGMAVGDEVEITLEVEAVAKKAQEKRS